jgi:carboxylesterase type B
MNRPSQQFAAKKTNGERILAGHNANEGGLFVPPLTTEADLTNWLQTGQFPNLTPAEINTILAANPNDAPTNTSGPYFETNGLAGGNQTAVHVSQVANGQQQRGNNIYAEATFACPAYWLASAYASASSSAASSWVYQYSVPFASHGADVAGYFGPATPNQSADFALAFRRIWGNFVRTGNPSISAREANGAGAASPDAPHPATNWPAWSEAQPQLMNLNSTGGVPYQGVTPWGAPVTMFAEPGLENAITLASAAQWEGGRKGRCDVYKGLAASVPI